MTAKVRIEIEEGWHVYVPPTAKGFVPLEVGLRGSDGVFAESVRLPQGAPFKMEGLPEQFYVVEGTLDVVVPFYVLEDTTTVDLKFFVDYQACSETTCLPPETLGVDFTIAERKTI
ncbi:MAG: protein-disulfide reductase DsbD N-terminal domain-containing protein [Actinomycetota bacterium]|nr:protein-disulfide reductase DsbD N-terminal domain-containing protein [Actinomycetota bacterium]